MKGNASHVFVKIIVLLIFSCGNLRGYAQELLDKINPDLLEKTWQARWIFHPEASGTGYGIFHFRKNFILNRIPEQFIIHVSADNRYRLFVNGDPVSFGPARGDILNWRYETVDIAKNLREGRNTIASVVWNFGEFRPLAQFTIRTAFIVQGNSITEKIVNTGQGWKVMQNKAYKPIPVDDTMVKGYYVCGPGDEVNASDYPWEWESVDFDDSDWMEPSVIWNPGVPRGVYNYAGQSGWNLVPRNIPLMEEKTVRFPEIVRSDGASVHGGFINGTDPLTIPPDKKVTILLDQNELTIGYPELWVSGGEGSRIQLGYAEALVNRDGLKGNRNETEGKELKGYIDIFYPDGGDRRMFRPLWYRTWRYMEMLIETGDKPLVIHDFYGIFTAYPFERNAKFNTEEQLLTDIWDVGWRTARLCATETYSDCPYYEQLQYVGDTRIQALISLYLSGDNRLMKNAIVHFDNSRIPDGLTYSRYPSHFPQISPPYSLIWILMIYDYYMLQPDPEFTGQFMLGIDNVLYWFEDRLDKNGLLGRLQWPNYMDAAPGFGPAGSPPSAENGHSAQITLLFAYTLDHAAVLADYHDLKERATRYRELSSGLKNAVYKSCYDQERKLFAETPRKEAWTQHTNILAVLTDAIPVEQQKEMVLRLLKDKSLIPAMIYFSFYKMQAMKKVGLGDLYLENLEPWEIMINEELTTFAEHALEGRSDCHAWSAHPCYDFLATVCGIEPAEPGFKAVKIQPYLGRLKKVNGSMPHPEGEIHVDLTRKGEKGLTGVVYIPETLKGKFYWNNRVVELKGGRQFVEF